VVNTPSPAPKVGGTQDWQSYAYVRAGIDWQLRDENDKARRMFLKALDHDPDNPVALFNLASCNVRACDYDLAVPRLRKAKVNAHLTDQRDALWYKAAYQLAATYAYKSTSDKRHLNLAEVEAYKLVEALDQALGSEDDTSDEAKQAPKQADTNDGTKWVPESAHISDETKRVLESIRPIAEILYTGIVADTPDSEHKTAARQRLAKIETEESLSKLSYRARYNLACYYAREGARVQGKGDKEAAYTRALQHLEYALERGGSLVQWARDDPALDCLRKDEKVKVGGNETAKGAFDKLIQKYAPTDADGADQSETLSGRTVLASLHRGMGGLIRRAFARKPD
jgi:tetratricopeptide (TPR) repeat protein